MAKVPSNNFTDDWKTDDINKEDMSEKDYFLFDPDVTDLTMIVEEKKLHVSK